MSYPAQRRLLSSLVAVSLVGGAVVLSGALWVGLVGVKLAAAALGVALLIATASEGLVLFVPLQPVPRMFASMFVRGAGAVVAIYLGIAAGCDPKMIALIALPLYLSMVAAEVVDALQSQAETKDKKSEATRPVGV